MVFFGDFAQVPVIEQQLYRNPEFSTKLEFIKLKKIMCQENAEFKRYLSEIRLTNYTEEVKTFPKSLHRFERFRGCPNINIISGSKERIQRIHRKNF
jgi:hypothetical protein